MARSSTSWQKGAPSPNPKGKKPGTRNTATTARTRAHTTLMLETPRLVKLAVEAAKRDPGGPAHLALLDRVVPKLRPAELPKPLPIDPNREDSVNRSALIGSLAVGDISLDEAARALSALRLEDERGGILNIQINLGGPDDPPRAALPLVEVLQASHLPPDLRIAAGQPQLDATRMHRKRPPRRASRALSNDEPPEEP